VGSSLQKDVFETGRTALRSLLDRVALVFVLPRWPVERTGRRRVCVGSRGRTDRLGSRRGSQPLGGSGGGEGSKLGNKLYVGNLPFSTSEADLREMFGKHGALTSVKVITDRETGRSRGFGFVEYEDGASAEEALKALNGLQIDGRDLRVNEAHDKRDGGGGGGGGGDR
jgi:cold-inducible RNA-binding protein